MRGPSALTHTTLTLREKQPTLRERRMTLCGGEEEKEEEERHKNEQLPIQEISLYFSDLFLSPSHFSLQTSHARVPAIRFFYRWRSFESSLRCSIFLLFSPSSSVCQLTALWITWTPLHTLHFLLYNYPQHELSQMELASTNADHYWKCWKLIWVKSLSST